MELYHFVTFLISFCSVRTDDVVIRIIKSEGYHAELHSVITDDAYILSVHRIRPPHPTAKIVLIMHGLQVNSFSFVLPGNQRSLAFELANNGYDVWIGNARGTEFSKSIKVFIRIPQNFGTSVSMKLPRILAATNRSALHYVGNSQGATVIVALLSLKPEYNSKMMTLHLMTPVIFIRNMLPLWFNIFGPIMDVAETMDSMGISNEIFTIDNDTRKTLSTMCNIKARLTYNICKNYYNILAGHSEQWNDKLFINTTELFQHIPNSISLRQILHYIQLFRYGRFSQYYYQREKNLLLYNRTEPPEYNLRNIRAKIHILYGTTDNIAHFKDVEAAIEIFRPMIIGIDKMVGWNHADFLIAKDLAVVNEKIMKLMKQHSQFD